MKRVIIIADGMGDETNSKTPLEQADMPSVQSIFKEGTFGMLETCFENLPVESAICIMGILGYNPYVHYPNGRASFEALALGIPLDKNDIVFRCNIGIVKNNIIEDFSANRISSTKAMEYLKNFKFSNKKLFHLNSYQNLLLFKNVNIAAKDIICQEPHMSVGMELILPYSKKHKLFIDDLNIFLTNSLSKENYMLLPWSPSSFPKLDNFKEKTKLNAALVTGSYFLKGIAKSAGIEYKNITGATGFPDTNYKAKANAALEYIKTKDLTIIHINSPDESSHEKNYSEKVKSLENIDKYIVSPVLSELKENYANNFKILFCGDHPTSSKTGKHLSENTPYCFLSSDNLANENLGKFSENTCKNAKLLKSLSVIDTLL